jgi:Mg/Co/Ni transporter MgtE
MFTYERHLVVVLVIAVVIIAAAVLAAVLGVPVPFLADL